MADNGKPIIPKRPHGAPPLPPAKPIAPPRPPGQPVVSAPKAPVPPPPPSKGVFSSKDEQPQQQAQQQARGQARRSAKLAKKVTAAAETPSAAARVPKRPKATPEEKQHSPHVTGSTGSYKFELASNLAKIPHVQFLGVLMRYSRLFLHAFALKIEVFTHTKMGERHVSPLFLILFFIEVGLVLAASSLVTQFLTLGIVAGLGYLLLSPFVFLFEFAALGLIFWHWWHARKSREAGEERHSYSTGIPLIAKLKSDEAFFYTAAFRTYVQPLALIVGGLFIGATVSVLGFLIAFYSFCLFLRNLLLDLEANEVMLNISDGQIVAKYHEQALNGAKPQDAGGLDFKGVTAKQPTLIDNLDSIKSAFKR